MNIREAENFGEKNGDATPCRGFGREIHSTWHVRFDPFSIPFEIPFVFLPSRAERYGKLARTAGNRNARSENNDDGGGGGGGGGGRP